MKIAITNSNRFLLNSNKKTAGKDQIIQVCITLATEIVLLRMIYEELSQKCHSDIHVSDNLFFLPFILLVL